MNTPLNITSLDLLRLALDEFKRYDDYASSGHPDMFTSARLARELVREAIEVARESVVLRLADQEAQRQIRGEGIGIPKGLLS